MIYPNGMLIILFATINIRITGIAVPTKIPAKTNLSLLFIVYQKLILLLLLYLHLYVINYNFKIELLLNKISLL